MPDIDPVFVDAPAYIAVFELSDNQGGATRGEVNTAVTATAPGDAFGGFQLTAPAVQPLVVPDAYAEDMTPDADYTVTWATPDPGARIRVRLESNYVSHSTVHAVIECDVPDTGSLTIPQSLIAAWWPERYCGSSWIRRYRAGATNVGGIATELRVFSHLRLQLDPWCGV